MNLKIVAVNKRLRETTMNTYQAIPKFFSERIRNALKEVENVMHKCFSTRPIYEVVNLKLTTPTTGNGQSRNYVSEFKNIADKQGLYIIYPTNYCDEILYIGKTGRIINSHSCDVFYKPKEGSGRIPHHIKGKKGTMFEKAHRCLDKTMSMSYDCFVNQYSVLCVVIDPTSLGSNSNFEKLLLQLEAYLILSLLPTMNENVNINFIKKSEAQVFYADINDIQLHMLTLG